MLRDFLQVKLGDKIAFAGAGGKTSAIMNLAKELSEFKVLVTTTTKMFWEEQAREINSLYELQQLFAKSNVVISGKKLINHKMGSYDLAFLAKLTAFSDIALIEADGAQRKPFKLPRDYEPVYPDFVNKIVYVVGMSALNQPLINLSRSDLLQDFLGKNLEDKLTVDDIIKVLLSKRGAKKSIGDRKFYVILNQADDEFLRTQAKIIADNLARENINVLINSFKSEVN